MSDISKAMKPKGRRRVTPLLFDGDLYMPMTDEEVEKYFGPIIMVKRKYPAIRASREGK